MKVFEEVEHQLSQGAFSPVGISIHNSQHDSKDDLIVVPAMKTRQSHHALQSNVLTPKKASSYSKNPITLNKIIHSAAWGYALAYRSCLLPKVRGQFFGGAIGGGMNAQIGAQIGGPMGAQIVGPIGALIGGPIGPLIVAGIVGPAAVPVLVPKASIFGTSLAAAESHNKRDLKALPINELEHHSIITLYDPQSSYCNESHRSNFEKFYLRPFYEYTNPVGPRTEYGKKTRLADSITVSPNLIWLAICNIPSQYDTPEKAWSCGPNSAARALMMLNNPVDYKAFVSACPKTLGAPNTLWGKIGMIPLSIILPPATLCALPDVGPAPHELASYLRFASSKSNQARTITLQDFDQVRYWIRKSLQANKPVIALWIFSAMRMHYVTVVAHAQSPKNESFYILNTDSYITPYPGETLEKLMYAKPGTLVPGKYTLIAV